MMARTAKPKKMALLATEIWSALAAVAGLVTALVAVVGLISQRRGRPEPPPDGEPVPRAVGTQHVSDAKETGLKTAMILTTPSPSEPALVARNVLGQTLRELRLERGITQLELARRTGLSPTVVSRIESGKGVPSVTTLHRLGRGLGVRSSELMRAAEVRAGSESQ